MRAPFGSPLIGVDVRVQGLARTGTSDTPAALSASRTPTVAIAADIALPVSARRDRRRPG